MKENYNEFLLNLFIFDISCIISGLIMLIPAHLSIPYSFDKLGVVITNFCIFIYSLFMNISFLLYIPLFVWYMIQKDNRSESNE